jgi:hypothetical protein
VVLKCERGEMKRLYRMEAKCRQTMVLFGRMGFCYAGQVCGDPQITIW